jgi:predicted enzyme related to lactoylglutathione lyase
MSGINGIGWFEIGTDQPATTERFYADVFGWTFADDDDSTSADGTPYRIATTPGGAGPGGGGPGGGGPGGGGPGGGGLSGGVSATGGATPGYAIFYVLVADTAETCRQVEAAGGKVLVAPRTEPSGLTSAHLLDPTGNHIGIFTPPARH